MSHEMLTPEDRRREALENGSGVSSYLSGQRFDPDEQTELSSDHAPITYTLQIGRKPRPTGKSLEGKHGIQESQRIAAEALETDPMTPQQIRAASITGLAAVRAELHPRSDTPEARFEADLADVDPDYYDEQRASLEATLRARLRKAQEAPK